MQTASEYQELLNNPVNNSIEVAIHEAQLTWLVYIIGAAIGGRMTFTANDEHDILDGDLVVRVSVAYSNDFTIHCPSPHIFNRCRFVADSAGITTDEID